MESTKTCKLQGFHIVKPRTYPTTAITWATYLPGFEEQVFELLNKLVLAATPAQSCIDGPWKWRWARSIRNF